MNTTAGRMRLTDNPVCGVVLYRDAFSERSGQCNLRVGKNNTTGVIQKTHIASLKST